MSSSSAADLAAAAALTANVHGWLTLREGQALYKLARACTGRGAIVEIGSWKGKSTIWLAKGSQAGSGQPIHAVDPHLGLVAGAPENSFLEFEKNIREAGVADLVKPLVKTSEAAAREFDQPVELIFIDGVHEYDYVKQDLELWFPKVIEGGVMAFHDTTGVVGISTHVGAKQVVDRFVYPSRHFRKTRFVESLTVAEKVAANSLGERLHNRYMLQVKHAYEIGSLLHIPGPIRRTARRLLSLE
jgi:predicted O-methyltransferase YrrM